MIECVNQKCQAKAALSKLGKSGSSDVKGLGSTLKNADVSLSLIC